MKKLSAVCLACLLSLSLCACAQQPPSQEDYVRQYLESNPNAQEEYESAMRESEKAQNHSDNTPESSAESEEEVPEASDFDESIYDTKLYKFMRRYNKDSNAFIQIIRPGGFTITYVKKDDKLYYNIDTGSGGSTELFDGDAKYVLNDTEKKYVKIDGAKRTVPESLFTKYIDINKYKSYILKQNIGLTEVFTIYGGDATFEFSDEVKNGDELDYNRVDITDNVIYSIVQRDPTDDDLDLLKLPSDYKEG